MAGRVLRRHGPLSLLAVVVFWVPLFALGFGVVLRGLTIPLNAPESAVSLLTDRYATGATFPTLGLGDIAPVPGIGRRLFVSEAADDVKQR